MNSHSPKRYCSGSPAARLSKKSFIPPPGRRVGLPPLRTAESWNARFQSNGQRQEASRRRSPRRPVTASFSRLISLFQPHALILSSPFSGMTALRAEMATSIMPSSGSLGVMRCIHMPGAAMTRVTTLSYRPQRRMSS